MRRRNIEIEIIEVLLASSVVVMTIILLFQTGKRSILYPLIFGVSAVLSFLYAFEGILYNKNRVIRKRRLIIFLAVGAALVALTVFAILAIVR